VGTLVSPSAVKFLPVDFTKQSLEEILLANESIGYNPKGRSLFIWEGACMYLSDDAVDRTLAFIRSHSAPGSTLLFDYVDRDYAMSQGRDGNFYGGNKLYETCKKKREYLSFGIPQGEIGEWLKERGFELVKHWKRDEMEREFMVGSDGKVAHKADGPLAIALAKTTWQG
jgi:methyltransferase (TIGR00027 family)